MTQEQKAKAYDESLEKARLYWETDNDNTLDIKARGTMEHLFPELRESNDEKTRKEILEFFQQFENNELRGVNISDWIAWLEKQGEQKPADKEFTFKAIPRLLEMIEPTDRAKAYCQKLIDSLIKEGYVIDAMIVGECLKQMNGEDVPMATMDEQKPINNVEPKFHEGDWIVNNNSGGVYQVTEIRDDEYCLWPLDAEIMGYLRIIDVDNEYHLWSIEDAKDGDVLFAENFNNIGGCVFLFKGLDSWKFDAEGDRAIATGYCCTSITESGNTDFGIQGPDCVEIKRVHPATKEQRDLLFQKMHEAGYIFDFEKKELKKLKFRVGDEVITENEESLTITRIDEEGYWSNELFICDFDSECVWDLVEQKSAEWSEEDEKMYNIVFEEYKNRQYYSHPNLKSRDICGEILGWLKQRCTWKPSKAQMKALDSVIDEYDGYPEFDSLVSLKNDLKKL